MKTNNYVVNRDDILVGRVVKTIDKDMVISPGPRYKRGIFCDSAEYERDFECTPWLLENKPQILFQGNINISERSMLFVLEKDWSNDLLYDSPAYPVCNISSIEDFQKARITVAYDIYKIGGVLEYLKYREKITLEDAIRIKETLFSVDWLLDNSHLFGVYETYDHDSATEVFDSLHRHRTFNDWRDDGPIPERYFWAFYYNKQHRFENGIGERKDYFEPGPNEGKIKKLKL